MSREVMRSGGCIGLLTACLSEVGCTELHLARESCALLTGAVSRSRAWDRSRNVGYLTGYVTTIDVWMWTALAVI